MAKIAAGWRGGCIIRAQFLSEITKEYENNPDISNLILAPTFKDFINKNIKKLSAFIEISHLVGIPILCMSSSFDYILQIISPVLVSAQVQAQQRDYFGAHGYFKLVEGKPQILLNKDKEDTGELFKLGKILAKDFVMVAIVFTLALMLSSLIKIIIL